MEDLYLKKYDKSDPIVRKAILTVYKHKCFYTNEPLSYQELDIDHFIPIDFKKNHSSQYLNYLKELGISEEFNQNSLYNLVPTFRHINSKKGKIKFSIHNAKFYFEIIRRNVEKIYKNINQNRKRKEFEDIAYELELLDIQPSEVYDFLAREQSSNTLKEDIIDKTDCKLVRKNVILTGFFPSLGKESSGCLITFNNLKLRKCLITFSHDEIVSKLFVGLKTNFKLEQRGFICFKGLNGYTVQLGNNRFFLSNNEIKQLCDVIDVYGNEYIKRLLKIEKALGIQGVQKSKHIKSGYQLFTIKRTLWNKILSFTENFDYMNGNSEWHIFENHSSYIKVFGHQNNKHISNGYHAFIFGEPVEALTWESLRTPDNSVCLVWEMRLLNIKTWDDINCNKSWNLTITLNWLIDEFIPYVLFYYESKGFRKKSFEKFKVQFNINDYIDLYDTGK